MFRPRDLLLILLAVFLWGLNFIVIKIGLKQFPPLFFSALRFLFAAFPWVFFFPRGNIRWRDILSVGLFIGLIQFTLLFLGMRLGMPAGLSSLVMQTQIVFTLFLGIMMLRERPGGAALAGAAMAIAGMAVIAATVKENSTVTGFLLLLAGAFSWSIGNIMIKRAGSVDMLRLMIWMSLVPPLPLLVLSAMVETGQSRAFMSMGWQGVAVLAYAGIASVVIAFGIWGRMLYRYPATAVAPFSILVPVFGITLSAFLLGEELGPLRIAGSLLAIAGLAVTVFGTRLHALLTRRP